MIRKLMKANLIFFYLKFNNETFFFKIFCSSFKTIDGKQRMRLNKFIIQDQEKFIKEGLNKKSFLLLKSPITEEELKRTK